MGKASTRQRKRRQEFLARLAADSPTMFQREWAQRLESWGREVRRRAGRLCEKNGAPVPPAFEIVVLAMKELAGCGNQAVTLEGDATREVLADQCCRALAQAVDRRMYHLSNAKSNQEKMKKGIRRTRR